jgi:polar amino acid transport system substrate-binding protein
VNRSLLRLLGVLLALLLTAGACGDDDDGADAGGTGDDTSEAADLDLVEDGKLTVCSDIPYAPFEFEEGGELKGVDIDLMKAVADKLGLEAEFRDTDFEGIFAALAARNCDVIASSVSITDEREEENDFTEGYFEINQSMLVRKGEESTLKDFASLKGKTIGVQSETTGAEFAMEEAEKVDAEVKEFTGADELFTALKAKQVDAVVQDFPINAYHAENTGETVVSATFEADEPEQYGFVVKQGNADLLEAIDKALEELKDDGTYEDILDAYLGDEAGES